MWTHFKKRYAGITAMILTAVFLVFGVWAGSAQAFTLNVVNHDGVAIDVGFRWLLERDNSFVVEPGVIDADSQAINFHKSYMPVVDSGSSASSSTEVPADSEGRFFVSVLPDSGYTMTGAPIIPGQDEATVVVHPLALPTAQFSIFVFEDNAPLNNAPDLPGEQGLEGFGIVVEDAGGKYGIVGGQQMMDAYGNMIGTTYAPDGTVASMGTGIVKTDADGFARVKNLAPGKYGVLIVPPLGEDWHQVTTIEGKKVIDVWVKADEPSTMVEFGVQTHVFAGFTHTVNDETVLSGGASISGQVTTMHLSRPPMVSATASGAPYLNVWVALNDATGKCVYAGPADEETAEFVISDVPPGSYQLVMWDAYLDVIISFQSVSVPEDGTDVDLATIAVPDWFAHTWHHVYYDSNGNGIPDDGELPMAEQGVLMRFRDGTVYFGMPTDLGGWAPMDEIFPFFNWLVAEVDFARFKATGLTVVVDAGGEVLEDHGLIWPSHDRLSPQLQPENGMLPYRTELGEVLTQAVQTFAGQTNVFYWGKQAYSPGENGGISGIIYYAITRAEDDPAYAAGEEWEPGIPRVQVNLYKDDNLDEIIDDLNEDGLVTAADVDNYPFGWADGEAPKGPEDIDQDGDCDADPDCLFDMGDAIQVGTTDSWDDNLPTDCPGDPADPLYLGGRCYEGFRNFNQARPGVFDGGYAFGDLEAGRYIVESAPPPGYKTLSEEHKNVDFGEEFMPSELLLPAMCVGDMHTIPDYVAFQTDDAGVPLPSIAAEDLVESPYAGEERHQCNRKVIHLSSGKNAAVDFFMLTDVPIAAHYAGLVTNDLGNEFNPENPNFIEKYGAPYMPISMRDWKGNEIARVYTDQYGLYNGLLPSTYTINLPSPSGVGASMYSICVNDAGPVPDAANPGETIIDPFFRREYTQSCYTFQFMTGSTTYLDTPVLPTTAFASRSAYPLDCEARDGVPLLQLADGPDGGPLASGAGDKITLFSQGPITVRNPEFDPYVDAPVPATIVRDGGFGDDVGKVFLDGIEQDILSWTDAMIEIELIAGAATGQLIVERGDNMKSTQTGITLTVEGGASVINVPADYPTIQGAIDAATAGDLVLVAPGEYDELIVLYKEIRLQGSGAMSTFIRAHKAPPEKLQLWREKISSIIEADAGFLLPGQEPAFSDFADIGLFSTELGPGILVLAKEGLFTGSPNARIDGFTVTGADGGGAVMVNGHAQHLEISNNHFFGNSGTYAGAVRLGHPVTALVFDGMAVDAGNDHVRIHHNWIAHNGALFGGITGAASAGGGGVAIYSGSDFYEITDNAICGNFTTGSGAGIGHNGLSNNGYIARNEIIFNEAFHQTISENSGGGISIEGIAGEPGEISAGSGSVIIDANLIQGNITGAGDGGGIRLMRINGADVDLSADPADWHSIDILNNFIVNNISGLAGGGLSLKDAAQVNIINNTIANNDSTATAGEAYDAATGVSTMQPAGIASHAHSALLAESLAAQGGGGQLFSTYSDPTLVNNIIWQNRSFYYMVSLATGAGGLHPSLEEGEDPIFWDLGVLGLAAVDLSPIHCDLTSTVGYDDSNVDSDPLFVESYFNGSAASVILADRATLIETVAAMDEGGNFIDVRFGPLTLTGDYHIEPTSMAINAGINMSVGEFPGLAFDIDGDERPFGGSVFDIGADETEVAGAVLLPPSIYSAPNTLGTDSVPYVYQVLAIDPNPGDIITYSLEVAPAGMTISELSGLIHWTPTQADVGENLVTVKAMDQGGLFDLQEYTLTVTDVNHAPVGMADYYEVNTNGDFVLDAPGVLANDFDADLDLLTALLRTELPVGNVSLAPDGSLVANMEEFVGTQSFLYQAYDGFTRSEVTAVVFFREVWVQKAKAIVKNNGINWVLKGYSSVPGSMVTIYVGDIADGIELATVTVAGNGVWRYRVRGSDIGPGPSETISVVTGSGFELLGVALEVE